MLKGSAVLGPAQVMICIMYVEMRPIFVHGSLNISSITTDLNFMIECILVSVRCLARLSFKQLIHTTEWNGQLFIER